MDASLRNRVTAVAKEALSLGEALQLTGWSVNASRAAHMLKHRDPLGRLASELAGWRRVQKRIPQTEVEVLQVVPATPVDPIAAVLLAEIRVLLDQLIHAERQYQQEVESASESFYLSTVQRGMGDAEAKAIGEQLVRMAHQLDRRAEVPEPHGDSAEAKGSDPDRWLTATEAAAATGMSKGRISHLCRESKVKSRKEGRSRLVDMNSLASYRLQSKRLSSHDAAESDEEVEQLMRQAGFNST